ncbi:hypothetical protein B0H34DRAFT_523979 [Crassisporium funariophilum]|nr:hypothetical protein B0H34DRAFT_523979 [Crassisporium funariophilum]
MSSLSFKVVFPAPPPTTNELTASQRTQLVRKTKKIEQIFGTTPHLVEAGLEAASFHISLTHGRDLSQGRLTKTRRESVDSVSSASSYGSPISPIQRSASVSSKSSSVRSTSSRRSRASVASVESTESWPSDMKAPLLRLAKKRPVLETIPASPSPTSTTFTDSALDSRRSAINNDCHFTTFTISPNEDPSSPRSSVVLTSFNIPSTNSLRKQKMDRLRKKLGQDVPLDLVFPEVADSAQPDNIPSPSPSPASDRNKECPPLPPPTPRAKKLMGRISATRDSIAESTSIHRAKRQTPAKPTVAHKKSRSVPTLPPTPNPDYKRLKEKLSFIIECPDEHGSGCSEEFGLSRATSDRSDTSSDESEVRLWSTRRGYGGWEGSRSPSSASSNTSSDRAVSPTSPASPATGVSRRPSSYRKPAPAIC